MEKDEIIENSMDEKEEIIDNSMDKKDPDIEIKQEDISDGALLGEQLDGVAKPVLNEAFEAELEGKQGIKIKYTFNGDDVKEGLAIFQAVTLRKRNLIYTAILAVLFIFYVINIVQNPGDRFSIFIAAVSIAVMGLIWFMPKLHIKRTAETADKNQFNFVLTIYDSCVRIGEEKAVYILKFKDDIDKVFETDNLFMVCSGKERIFIIPKRVLDSEGVTSEIREILKNAMGNAYFDKCSA